MAYTVLHVLARPSHVNDAVRLLTRDWTGPGRFGTSMPGGTGLLVTTEATARALGPRLATTTGQPAIAITVEGERCALWLAGPDGRQVGPTEGGDAASAAEGVEAAGRWPGAAMRSRGSLVERVLADRTLPADERYRQLTGLLGLEFADPAAFRGSPGVLLARAAADVVLDRLPVDGHGAWVVPLAGDRSLVVPDGVGPVPQPGSFEGVGLRAATVAWGASPSLWAGGHRVALDATHTRDQARTEAVQIAQALDERELTEPLAEALHAKDLREELALRALGVRGVPVGASVEDLAAWAAAQPGSVRVPARAGTTLVPSTADDDSLQRQYRHKRALRRVRWATFAVGAADGLALVYAWDRAASETWLLITSVLAAAFVVLLASWLLLGRRLKSPERSVVGT